jgi:Asp-tRNA(Asn)/Glu-tRNA(Gln) amidotransferase A subunit family amidase
MRDLMAEGAKAGAVDYLDAIARSRAMHGFFDELFQQECSAIITPATTGIAPKGLSATGNPVFCSFWTLLGLPALTLPLLERDGMPIGVQLVGAKGDDARLIRTAAWLVDKFGNKKSGRRKKT